MTLDVASHVRERIDEVYRSDSRRVLATLIRVLNDFDLADEALQDAFTAALERWPQEGIPQNPIAWLVSTGRFKAIDRLRRRSHFDTRLRPLLEDLSQAVENDSDDVVIDDDRLRLIFTCCHPSLSPDAQIALTLREVCGLTTEEIARAFLTPAPTLAQRIVRAKAKIRDANIPYQLPERDQLNERLGSVLHVVYLVFNEGYSATSGENLTRTDLCNEAIVLARLISELLPEPEALGLLALLLLHDARRSARISTAGEMILLGEQDRTLWNRAQIAEGVQLVERSLRSRAFGPYALQAAIAAVHAEAKSAAATDWNEILGLYDVLMRADPSPVIELNRAVALAMRDGPQAGIAAVENILKRGELSNYQFAYSAHADLCRRAGLNDKALESYRRALELTVQEPERKFLLGRIAALTR